ncbi:MAG: pantoate--beta-alanine ligase [Abditibacteriales bacterium]|nr:pantoate--beta-alanine ligase [Abditibacteriales bacterium]MDW8366124.1 pantoate--beta-alanine ligase [Abditibacteriales bacterium]
MNPRIPCPMNIITDIAAMQQTASRLRREGKTIGVVPTMGYFHEGHLSLMRRARAECEVVIVTLFVNPAQFAPHEDFASYPRDFERDCQLAEAEGVDILFAPTAEAMYPDGYETFVTVENLTQPLCGASRPGHFRGVTTVVAKLFNITQPHRAYFGLKDYQQCKVIQKMVRDLNFDITIVPCPIVREPDGLAMSSRNAYLSPAERQAALALHRALRHAEQMVKAGERDARVVRDAVQAMIAAEPLAWIDYVEVVDAETLQPVEQIQQNTLVALAVKIGRARLIDNTVIDAVR